MKFYKEYHAKKLIKESMKYGLILEKPLLSMYNVIMSKIINDVL
jgi:hypothetical protein